MKKLVLVLFLFAAGCATTEPLKLDAGGEQRVSAADAVKIAISEADAHRVDPHVIAFGQLSKQPVDTGPIWRRVFVGDPKTDPVFTVISAQLRDSIAGAGFTMRFTYVIEGRLALDGYDIPIRAEGSRAAAMALPSAMRQAVELGIADAARQAAAIRALKKKEPNQTPEPTAPSGRGSS